MIKSLIGYIVASDELRMNAIYIGSKIETDFQYHIRNMILKALYIQNRIAQSINF